MCLVEELLTKVTEQSEMIAEMKAHQAVTDERIIKLIVIMERFLAALGANNALSPSPSAVAVVPDDTGRTAELETYRKYVMFPTRDVGARDMNKLQLASFWRVEEFSDKMDQDVRDWTEKLTPEERQFMSMALAFFAASDGIVTENLVARFCLESDVAEVRAFYVGQAFFEQVHSEAYSLIIDRLIPDAAEKNKLFRAVEHHVCVRRKAEWGRRWIESVDGDRADGPARRLAAFACVEGIFFSSSFATIYWFKGRNLLPGTTLSNEWISRDEGLHTDFAVYRYRQLPAAQQMSADDLRALVDEAVHIEQLFVEESLPQRLPGMNAELMCEYVRFVADRLLVQFGLPPMYDSGDVCPFPFMTKQAGLTKSNFFETQVSNYSAAVRDADEFTYHAGVIDDGDF